MGLRRTIWITLSLTLCFTATFKSDRSDAVLPAIAAYATLEIVVLSSAAAAAAGIITYQQNRAMQRQVEILSQRLAEATGDAINGIYDQVKALYKTATEKTKGKTKASTDTISPAADADCKDGLNESPTKCCPDWLKSAENIENVNKKGLNYILTRSAGIAYQIFDPNNGQLRCCLNWDPRHARFEVFTPGGSGKYRSGDDGPAYTHHGEFSCKNGGGDPCSATEPGKADNLGKHTPRDGCKDMFKNLERFRRSGQNFQPAEAVK